MLANGTTPAALSCVPKHVKRLTRNSAVSIPETLLPHDAEQRNYISWSFGCCILNSGGAFASRRFFMKTALSVAIFAASGQRHRVRARIAGRGQQPPRRRWLEGRQCRGVFGRPNVCFGPGGGCKRK